MNRLAQNKTRCRFGNHVRSLSAAAAECVMKSWFESRIKCDEDPLFRERSERTNEQTKKGRNEETKKGRNEETKKRRNEETNRTQRHSPFAIRHSPFAIRHSPFAIRHSPFAIRHSPFAHSPIRPFDIRRSGVDDRFGQPACLLRVACSKHAHTIYKTWCVVPQEFPDGSPSRFTMNDER